MLLVLFSEKNAKNLAYSQKKNLQFSFIFVDHESAYVVFVFGVVKGTRFGIVLAQPNCSAVLKKNHKLINFN